MGIISLLKRYILFFVVFVTGACVLVIEIVALRVLSPYYGNTIFSASSVITVILAALSIGYYGGGRLADARPSFKLFYGIIFASGIAMLALQLLSSVLLPFLGYQLSLVSGPLLSSFFLFFLPGLLLGTLSPFAITLQKLRLPQEGIGTISGKIFFWSTCGSITGSLAAGFLLIPRLGVQEIFLGTGVLLLGVGISGMIVSGVKKEVLLICAGVSTTFVGSVISSLVSSEKHLYENDGIYEKIVIYDALYEGRPARFLKQDWSFSSAMFLDSEDLVYEYTKYYQLYKIFTPNLRETLTIGAGAWSVPKALLRELPTVRVDVVDIEPVLAELGKQFFRVSDDPRLRFFEEDGRRFLRLSPKQYDLIFSDVYVTSIPIHFATREFFEIAKEKLNPEGILIANIIGDLSGQLPSFVLAEMKTLRSVFPRSYFFAVRSPKEETLQNLIFVGHKSDRVIDLSASTVQNHEDEFVRQLPEKSIDPSLLDLARYPLLTDNFAPVEYLTAQTWRGSIAEDR